MLGDSKNGYGLVSIIFHWLGAAAICVVWWLGNRIDDVARTEKAAAQELHFAVAVVALTIILPRLLWRFGHRTTPMAVTSSPFLDRVALWVKWGLVTLMSLLVISGPLDVWTGRRGAINVFGTIIPSPIPQALNGVIHQVTGVLHVVSAKAILVLVALHVLGALKHLVLDRDGVFWRMIVPAK